MSRNYVREFTYKPDCHIFVIFGLTFKTGKLKHFVRKNFVKPECNDTFDTAGNTQQAGNFPRMPRVNIEKMRILAFCRNVKHILESFNSLGEESVDNFCVHCHTIMITQDFQFVKQKS